MTNILKTVVYGKAVPPAPTMPPPDELPSTGQPSKS